MQDLTIDDPKVVEMSYTVFEKILTSIDFETKEELLELANIMVDRVENGDYPEILKLAYKDAHKKIEVLNTEQLKEIKKIITQD